MNDQMQKRLNLLLNGFRITEECSSELLDILNRSGLEEDFFISFKTRIKQLDRFKHNVIKYIPDGFEKLKNASGLYSMRIKLKKNIRIIYGYNGNELLLLAFEERAGKRSSDYTNKIEIAKHRLEKIKKERRR